MFVLVLLFTFCGFFYLKFYLPKRRLLKYVQHLPTANDLPIIGMGHRFFGKTTSEIMKELIHMSEAVENPSRRFLGPTLMIIVSSPEDTQTILNSPHCLQKPHVYDFIADNVGLFSSKAHIWKPTRKLLNPTFNHKILSSFIPIFNEKSKIIASNLERFLGQTEQFDVAKLFFACTLEMVCATTLGVDLEFQKEKNSDVLEAMEKITEVSAERMVKVWLHPDFIFKRTKLGALHTHLVNTVERLPQKIRKIKEKEFNESRLKPKETSNQNDRFKEPQIFVNELLQLKSAGLIDDRMVDDQIATIIAGGTETSALTMSHVFLMLAIHQDIQERLFQEIKSAHSGQYSDTDSNVLSKLPYLEMVIRETMRLFPVAPFLGRESLEDVKISNCTIPKNSMILLAIHVLHRNKAVWGPHPDQFNPEHFLPEKMSARHPYNYLPFSSGPRNCIDKYVDDVAAVEAKVIPGNLTNPFFLPYNNVLKSAAHFKGKFLITIARANVGIPSTLNYIPDDLPVGSSPSLRPYPDFKTNELHPELKPDENRIVSVYRTRVDDCGRLWFVDTGALQKVATSWTYAVQRPSLWVIDLKTDERIRRYEIADTIVKQGQGMISLKIDVDKDKCNEAFDISDYLNQKVYVYSFEKNRMWPFRHVYFNNEKKFSKYNVDGYKFEWFDGVFSVTLGRRSANCYRKAFFHPMASNSEFEVSTKILQNETLSQNPELYLSDFVKIGNRGNLLQSAMHDFDEKTSVIFFALISKNAISCWNSNTPFKQENHGNIIENDAKFKYPSDLNVDSNGTLLALTNNFIRYESDKLDTNEYNFRLWRGNTKKLIKDTICAPRKFAEVGKVEDGGPR